MDKKTKNEWSKWSKESKEAAIVLSVIVIMTLGGLVAGAFQGCSPIKPTHDGKPKFELKNPISIIKQKTLEVFQYQK